MNAKPVNVHIIDWPAMLFFGFGAAAFAAVAVALALDLGRAPDPIADINTRFAITINGKRIECERRVDRVNHVTTLSC